MKGSFWVVSHSANRCFFKFINTCENDRIKIMLLKIFVAVMFLFTGCAIAADSNIEQSFQNFSIKSEKSRVIYRAGSTGASLVIENPQPYPILVQTQTLMADKQKKGPFIVTPPLFRLDAKQENRIKIVAIKDTGPEDVESLYWLCMTGIPPTPDSVWDGIDKSTERKRPGLLTQVRVKSCIKLIVRPKDLKDQPVDQANYLIWHKSGNRLIVTNPTPYYINMKNVNVGKTDINNPGYVSPKGQLILSINAADNGFVHWKMITDNGGESKEIHSELK